LASAGEDPLELACAWGRERGERLLTVGQFERKIQDYLGLLPALVLTGESLRTIAGSPAERRRFVDRAVAAADPAYVGALADYRRALAQRNRLLREGRPDREIAPWNEVLAGTGTVVTERRRRQVEVWQEDVGGWPELFPEGGTARLAYLESGSGKGREGEKIIDRLARVRDRERRYGMTLVGPHRDDLAVDAEGRDLLRQGSSGQVRAALSALLLAQARQVRRQAGGKRPLLVLDDVDTDLDAARGAALLEAAREEGQVLAATSKPGLLNATGALVLVMEQGAARVREGREAR
jgi:DNA replication and repair protein RecF